MTPSGARVGTEISLFATRSGTVRGGHTITAAHAVRKHQDEHNRRRSGRAGCMFGDDPCYLHLSFRHPGGDTMKEMTLLITRATMFDLAVLGVVIITWTIIGSVVIGLLCVAAATTMAAIVKLVDSERHVLGFLGWIAIVIPNPIDQNPWAHWRSPMDMMRQGWSTSLFHAAQQWSTRSS